jgi:hypothetical protein
LWLHEVTGLFSYNPHTVRGAWTFVSTAIFVVFGFLLALRVFVPVKVNTVTVEEELSEIPNSAPATSPVTYVVEAQQS